MCPQRVLYFYLGLGLLYRAFPLYLSKDVKSVLLFVCFQYFIIASQNVFSKSPDPPDNFFLKSVGNVTVYTKTSIMSYCTVLLLCHLYMYINTELVYVKMCIKS